MDNAGGRRGSRWRIMGWGLAACVLLLPFVAMKFTTEVNWTASDFVVFGAMLAVGGGTLELAMRGAGNGYYRGGAAAAVAAGFLLVWVNGAVGFLGDEDNPANLMFLGVLAVAIAGAVAARARPEAMARAMLATAAAQTLVGAVGLGFGLGSPGWEGLYEVVMGTGLFDGLWLLSAWLFHRAARAAASTAQ
jgi:hypothetical protein